MMAGMGLRAALALAAIVSPLAGAPAGAAQYSITAQAGGDGDSNESLDDPSASADYTSSAPSGTQSYSAAADAGGSLSASGAWEGNPPSAAITRGATGRIAETILFDAPLPSGDVTIRVGSVSDVSASSSGFGSTSAFVQVGLGDGLCSAGHSFNSVTGAFSGGSCDGGGGTSVQYSFTPQQLSARNWQVNFEAQATVDFSNAGALDTGLAQATAGIYVTVSGAGAGGYHFTGSQSAFPVPEPDATALGVAVLMSLAARRWLATREDGGSGFGAGASIGVRGRARS